MCDCKIPEPLEFGIGDRIHFNDCMDKFTKGVITSISKHGYWVKPDHDKYGTGSIRCLFDNARRI
jgi:hypothetical protein